MDIVFLGGVFPKHLESSILEDSIEGVQFAANNLQWNIIEGLDLNNDSTLHLRNLMFIGSFPKRYRKSRIRSERFSHQPRADDVNIGFINLTGVKVIARFMAALSALFRWSKIKAPKKVIVVYSVHSPFLVASFIVKSLFRNIKLCLIVPDLPEHMSDRRALGYKILKFIDRGIIRPCVRKFDAFVVLSKYMVGPLQIKNRPWICIEGISDKTSLENIQTRKTNKKTVLYSGSLAKRYGIINLLDAFRNIANTDYQLLICGSGDAEEIIVRRSQDDPRIHFYGKMPRAEVLKLQQMSTILINPRTSEGDYTKYSFPSKIVEYFSSGTPMIMHRLPGIPDEYFDYCFVEESESVEGLANMIIEVCELKREVRDELGRRARVFIQDKKGPKVQGQKIHEMLNSLFDK